MAHRSLCFSILLVLVAACAATPRPFDGFELQNNVTVMDAPAPAANPPAPIDAARVRHGQCLVELLGCGACHTDGALIGAPDMSRRLAGSHVGIAYGNPLKDARPGIVFPANLTPDAKTGIGEWSDAEIVGAIRNGVDRSGRQHLGVMPWPAYRKLSDEDAMAITSYLRALPAVEHKVPENVRPGGQSTAPFVHFGVYSTVR